MPLNMLNPLQACREPMGAHVTGLRYWPLGPLGPLRWVD